MATKPDATEAVAEPVAPALNPALDQLVDLHWPTGGEAWQQQAAFRARNDFKTALATTLSNQ